MKKTIVLTAMAVLLAANCMAQEFSIITIYTKGGQAVEALIRGEFSSAEIQEYDRSYQERFPLATMLGSTSNTYNSHGYAWSMTDGGRTCCIDFKSLADTDNVSKYWTNDYYTATTEDKAVKVFYYNSDHSAVVSKTVPGMYESKWSHAPLMRHAPGYGPYKNMNDRRYYMHERPALVTGAISCSNGTGEIDKNVRASYSVISPPAGAVRMVYTIDSAKGDNAVETGQAVVHKASDKAIIVSFTQGGVYDMCFRYYTRFNELVGEYGFQALVNF